MSMKMIVKAAILSGSLLAATSAFADEQTVILEVSGMTCVSCPYIVRESLAAVDGVSTVEVSMADRSAIVTFDDSRTDIAALTSATTEMGFPSMLND